MDATQLKATVTKVIGYEAKTKAGQSLLSRDGLLHLYAGGDIAQFNRLIAGLTPRNRTMWIAYLETFSLHQVEKDKDGNFVAFGGHVKGDKNKAKRRAAMEEFLGDPENDIWTWAAVNMKDGKIPDYMKTYERALDNVLKGNEEKGVEPAQVFDVITTFISKVSLAELIDYMDKKQKADEILASASSHHVANEDKVLQKKAVNE
jgi:hypothetical protein